MTHFQSVSDVQKTHLQNLIGNKVKESLTLKALQSMITNCNDNINSIFTATFTQISYSAPSIFDSLNINEPYRTYITFTYNGSKILKNILALLNVHSTKESPNLYEMKCLKAAIKNLLIN